MSDSAPETAMHSTRPFLRGFIALALLNVACAEHSTAPSGGSPSGGTATRLAFTVQPSAATGGAVETPAVQVTVQDIEGNAVTGATTSVTIAITGGAGTSGATLGGTLTRAAGSGVATFSDLMIDKAGTGYTLTATATGLTSATSAAFAIGAGAAAKLAFSQQPSQAMVGAVIAPAVVVTVQDAQGNTVTGSTAGIALAVTSGTGPTGAVLGGTLSRAAVAGVATFDDARLDTVATGYTLTATAAALTSATSTPFTIAGVPGEVDWRSRWGQAWVTSVKNQGACGDPWIFPVTAAVESRMMIKAGDPTLQPDLSEQQILDATPGDGCQGGAFGSALAYLRDSGVVSEAQYPYVGVKGTLSVHGGPNRITGYAFLPPTLGIFDHQTVRQELAARGPVPVYVHVYSDFFSYTQGVYTRTSTTWMGVHAIVLVGYSDSAQYWVGKNSWGPNWGEAGYIRMSYQDDSLLSYPYSIRVP